MPEWKTKSVSLNSLQLAVQPLYKILKLCGYFHLFQHAGLKIVFIQWHKMILQQRSEEYMYYF